MKKDMEEPVPHLRRRLRRAGRKGTRSPYGFTHMHVRDTALVLTPDRLTSIWFKVPLARALMVSVIVEKAADWEQWTATAVEAGTPVQVLVAALLVGV